MAILVPSCLWCQGGVNAHFNWHQNTACKEHSPSETWFVKVEEDPVVVDLSKNDFKNLLSAWSDKVKMDSESNGHLRLKVYFAADGHMCLGDIGERQLSLTEKQRQVLYDSFVHVSNFNPGRQRGTDRNCIGLIFLEIKQGQIATFQHFNMAFSN